MRKVILGIVIALVVVIVGLFAAASLIDVNKYRPQIQAQIEKAINRQVTLGTMSLKIFPLGVKIDSLRISDDPAFQTQQPFAVANDVTATAGLFSLISGSPEIKTVTLNRPQVELIRNRAGIWNFSSMSSTKEKSSNDSSFSLASLKLNDGQVAYTDLLQGFPRAIYDHIGLELTDYAPNRRFGLNLDVHFPGPGKQLLSLQSKVGPIAPGQATAAIPVDGKIDLQEVTISGFSKFAAGAIPPNTDGVISGDATISSQSNALAVKGNLQLADATIRGSKIGYPIDARFDLTDNRQTDLLDIKSADVKLGQTPFTMAGTVDSSKRPANLNVKVTTSNASLTELAKLAGSFGVAFNPAYRVEGRLTANVDAKGTSAAPLLSGKVSGSGINISGAELKQPVQISNIDLSLSPESIVSNPFTAQSGSTRVDANFTASNYTNNNMGLDATLKTNNADIAELINMAKAYGVEASQGMTGTGRLSLNAHVQGPLHDTARLNYSGSGSVANAQFNAPAVLTKPVSIPSANLNLSQNSVGVSNLVMSVGGTSVRGNLSAKNLAAPQVSFQLAADRINTAELEQLTATPSSKAAAPAPKSAAAPAAKPQSSLLSRTTGGGTLAAGSIVASDLTLQNVRATVKLNNGVITLSPLTSDLYGGKESGTLTLDTRPANTLCSVNAKLSGVDTNALLSAVSSSKDTLYGSLAANSNLSFALLPGNDLPRTLNGTLGFNVGNGELKRVNILNEVSQIGKFLNAGHASSSGNSTKLTKLSGTLNFHNGEGTTNDLVAAIEGGSVSAKGLINLATQALNLDVSAVLNSGISAAAGGTKVGGFLSTTLANNKGELVIPAKVTGTLQKPVFSPDPQAMAQMKLKNLLPTTGNPAAGIAGAVLGNKGGGAGSLVKGILGGGQDQTQQQQQPGQPGQKQPQPQQQKPADAIKGILKGFGKKNQ